VFGWWSAGVGSQGEKNVAIVFVKERTKSKLGAIMVFERSKDTIKSNLVFTVLCSSASFSGFFTRMNILYSNFNSIE
jgi:hypothetical protein